MENEPLRYECSVCDAKFDGNLKLPHLVGVKHRYAVVVSNNPSSSIFCISDGITLNGFIFLRSESV